MKRSFFLEFILVNLLKINVFIELKVYKCFYCNMLNILIKILKCFYVEMIW